MKITNREIVFISKGILEIRKKKLPIRIGFALTKNISELSGLSQCYEESRLAIIDKYAEKDENGVKIVENGKFIFSDQEKLMEEITELLSIENEVNIHKVSIADLERCDEDGFDSLSPDDLEVLDFMITE